MTRIIFFILAVLSAALAFGQEIKVPKTVRSGDLIVVTAENPDAKVIFWDVIDPRGKFLFDPNVVYRNSRTPETIVIGGGEGEYQIALKMILEDGTSLQEYATCTRGGSGPPGPGPGPTPPPPGPGPELDDLGKISFTAASTLPANAKANLGKVAAAYRDVIKRAEAIESGYATVNEIQGKLQAARGTAQGDIAAWEAWNAPIKAEWDKMWQNSAGQVTKAQVLAFHKSVLAGLDAVKTRREVPNYPWLEKEG